MKVLCMIRQAFRVFYTVGLPANCKINLDINIYLQLEMGAGDTVSHAVELLTDGGKKKHTGDYRSFSISKICLQRTCVAFTIRK